MIMSRGRQAFSGDVTEAIPHFDSIGYPCPPATNPAEVSCRSTRCMGYICSLRQC
jgi:hypothetical protein